MPAMRKKERNGPGIATFVDSGDTALASPEDAECVSAARAKVEPTHKAGASMAETRKKDLLHRFVSKAVKNNVRALKIASTTKLNGLS